MVTRPWAIISRMYSASTMKTEKRRLTVYAVVIIVCIISAGIVSLLLQEKVTRFEAISAVGASSDSLWIIEGNRLMRYSHKGTFLSEFVFNASFSDVFTHKDSLLLYSFPDRSVRVYDMLARFKYGFPTESASAVYYDNGVFASITSSNAVTLYSIDGKVVHSYKLEHEPSGVVYIRNEHWYAPFDQNKLISLDKKREIIIKELPQGFSIIRGFEFNSMLYFIAAQRKGGSYYYARFYMYSLENGVLRQSVKRYIYPITITAGHKKIYIGSNLENNVDMYTMDGEYKGRFGDDSFIKKHSKMYLNRTRYVVIVMVMNIVVVVSFFLSIYVFILSNRLKKKEKSDAHA